MRSIRTLTPAEKTALASRGWSVSGRTRWAPMGWRTMRVPTRQQDTTDIETGPEPGPEAEVTCPNCDGWGEVPVGFICGRCGGWGSVPK